VSRPRVCHPSFWLQKYNSVHRAEAEPSTADEYFQKVAREAHERNKNIANPYEHENVEQYNLAFDRELEKDKKDIIIKTKLLTDRADQGKNPFKGTHRAQEASAEW
jgi:hypothetical protein